MSTLLDLGSGALTAIGQLGAGQTASPEDGALILRYANTFLAQCSTKRLLIYWVNTRQFALVPSTVDYSIGPTCATFTGPRPTFIESAQVNVTGGTWIPLSILDKAKWDAIVTKNALADIPDKIWPEYSYPNIGFHINPAPFTTPQIRLGCWEQLTQFVTLFDQIAFPPGYEEFIESSLAIILAPFYDQPVPPGLVTRQQRAEAAIMGINAQSLGGALSSAQALQSPNLGQPIQTQPSPQAPSQAPGPGA